MRLEGRTESANVEDRRGQRMRGGPAGLGCGGLLLVLAISYFTGQDPAALLQLLSTTQQATTEQAPAETVQPKDQLGKFAALVLADTEETWRGIFQETGQTYKEPPLVLFSQAVRSGCGTASSAMGPFYCPADHKVIDPGDFEEGRRAAASIGDDAIQEMTQGSIRPESWTHGSGDQRQFWLRRGLTTGDPNRCDTFKETRP